MTEPSARVEPDQWSRWLFDHRYGRSDAVAQENMGVLFELRDSVIDAAGLSDGDVVCDLGSGDGFIAFKAVAAVEPTGKVICTDISPALLDSCRRKAAEYGKLDRFEFVLTPAETLEGIEDRSADVVTSRSTLVYVDDKTSAFRNAVRVLKPGGRLSLMEPISSYGWRERSDRYMTWDVEGLGELGDRLDAYYKERDTSIGPRYDLDERQLVLWAEEAGLTGIHMRFTIDIATTPAMPWDTALEWSPNPCAPTLGQALDDCFDDRERVRVVEHLAPRIASGTAPLRRAMAHLVAMRP